MLLTPDRGLQQDCGEWNWWSRERNAFWNIFGSVRNWGFNPIPAINGARFGVWRKQERELRHNVRGETGNCYFCYATSPVILLCVIHPSQLGCPLCEGLRGWYFRLRIHTISQLRCPLCQGLRDCYCRLRIHTILMSCLFISHCYLKRYINSTIKDVSLMADDWQTKIKLKLRLSEPRCQQTQNTPQPSIWISTVIFLTMPLTILILGRKFGNSNK